MSSLKLMLVAMPNEGCLIMNSSNPQIIAFNPTKYLDLCPYSCGPYMGCSFNHNWV